MEDEKRIILYSYNKVWKFEKKVYAIYNVVLPVPIEINEFLYLILSVFINFLLGAIFPVINYIPALIRFLVLPWVIIKFLRKQKLDGKNPFKFLLAYLIYIFYTKNITIERFTVHPYKRKEEIKLNWNCSKGILSGSVYRGFSGKPISKKSKVAKNKTDKKVREETVREPKVVKKVTIPVKVTKEKVAKPNVARKKIQVSKEKIKTSNKKVHINKIKIGLAYTYQSLKKANIIFLNFVTGTKQQIKKNKKKKKIKRANTRKNSFLNLETSVVIIIYSMKKGIGCTHIANSFADYLFKLKRSVCILGETSIPNESIPTYHIDSFYDTFGKHDFIVVDAGCSSYQNVLKFAHIKIMMCVNEEDYLKKINDFIKKEEHPKKWKYLFNFVPEKNQKEVHACMEEYQHFCLPVFRENSDVSELYRKILNNEKINKL